MVLVYHGHTNTELRKNDKYRQLPLETINELFIQYLFGTHKIAYKTASNDSQRQVVKLWWTDA